MTIHEYSHIRILKPLLSCKPFARPFILERRRCTAFVYASRVASAILFQLRDNAFLYPALTLLAFSPPASVRTSIIASASLSVGRHFQPLFLTYYLRQSTDRRGDERGLGCHRLQSNDAKRLIWLRRQVLRAIHRLQSNDAKRLVQ